MNITQLNLTNIHTTKAIECAIPLDILHIERLFTMSIINTVVLLLFYLFYLHQLLEGKSKLEYYMLRILTLSILLISLVISANLYFYL